MEQGFAVQGKPCCPFDNCGDPEACPYRKSSAASAPITLRSDYVIEEDRCLMQVRVYPLGVRYEAPQPRLTMV